MIPWRTARGFTLLELMIALSLVGMLLLLLFGGLRLGSRSWDAAEQVLQTISGQVAVSGFLRRSLSQTYPWRFKSAEGDRLAFVGEAQQVRYVGPIPSRQGLMGHQLVQLALDDGVLLLRWQTPHADDQDFARLDEAEPIPLLNGVESMEIDYFGAQEADQTSDWQDAWQSDQVLPELLRIRLVVEGGRSWPDLIIPLMLPASANCRWDNFYKRCMDQPASGANNPASERRVPAPRS